MVKKTFLTLTVIIILLLLSIPAKALTAFWQEGIAYDNTGQILDNTLVDVRVKIIDGSGTTLYTQLFNNVATSQFAIFRVRVDGSSDPIAFNNINIDAVTRVTIETRTGGGVWVLSTVMTLVQSQYYSGMKYGWDLTGNSGTTAGTNFLGTTDGTDLNIDVRNSGTIEQSLRLNTNQAIYRESNIGGIVAGNPRGQYAVDLQVSRNAATQVASGNYSTIGGGGRNTAS